MKRKYKFPVFLVNNPIDKKTITFLLRWFLPDLDVVTEQLTQFGINISIIAFVLFVIGFVIVSALNFTAENQVRYFCCLSN